MINAKELRIGNWVSCNGKLVQVKEIRIDEIGYVDKPLGRYINVGFLHYFDSIPITEEILLKCGAEIKKGGISYDLGKLSIYFGDTILSGKDGRTYFNSWAILEFVPKYLHQLQNLYFALTNEELNINLQ